MNYRTLWCFLVAGMLISAGCDNSEKQPVHGGAGMIGLVAEGEPVLQLSQSEFGFTEGPVWNGADKVFFTDLKANKVYSYRLSDQRIEQAGVHSGQINGLKVSPQGELWGAVQLAGCIERMDSNAKTLWTVAGEYHGRPFNQPNDLALDAQGGVYFTDPSWNPAEKRNQPVKGVYYTDAAGKVTLLVDDLDKPNGILLAPGGAFLYVVDMGDDAFIRFPVVAPGQLGAREDFAKFATEGGKPAAPDGMAADALGNVYVATETGIQVFSEAGKALGTINTPQRPSNLAFFGKQLDRLFITAETNVYSLKMKVRGDIYPLVVSAH